MTSFFLVENGPFLQTDMGESIRYMKSSMKRILVIDDHVKLRQMLRQILEREGYEVIEAGDGKEGIKLYRQAPTDLVITEVVMPEKDGVEIARELKRDFPNVRIIAISGDSRALGAQYCLAAMKALGALHVFAKPFGKEELLEAVREILGCKVTC
jgi:CheY-like chemotaxis protein